MVTTAAEKPMTLEQLRQLHFEHEEVFLRKALAACEWKLVPTAERIGTSFSNVRRLLRDHPKVAAERKAIRGAAGSPHGGRPIGA